MPSVKITVSGVLFDKYERTGTPVTLVGEASLTGLGVGGGPIYPPEGGAGGPPSIWPPGIWPGPGDPDFPGGGGRPPGIWGGGNEPFPTPPIVIPPDRVPPALQPPTPPAPGSPTTVVPGNFPVSPITPPTYLVVNYPGIGPVYVAPPLIAAPAKK